MPEELKDKPGTTGTAVMDPPADDKTKVVAPPKETIENDLTLPAKERTAQRKAFMESHGYTYEATPEDKAAEEAEDAKAKDDETKAAADAEKKGKADEAKPAEGDPKPGDKPKEAEDDDDPKPKRKRKAAAPTIDYDELASKVAERTRQDQPAPDPKTTDKPAPATTDDSLTYAENKELKVLSKMTQLNPAVGDMAGKMKTFWEVERQYKVKWENQNPGVEFDDTDPIHDKFYAKEPTYDAKLYDDAQTAIQEERIQELATQRAEEIIKKTVTPELQKRRAQEAFQQAQPEIQSATNEAMVAMLEKSTPELAKLLTKGKNGQAIISQEAVTKMEETDPVAFEIVHDESRKLHVLVSELHKLDRLGEYYKPNRRMAVNIGSAEEPEPFYAHNELLNFIDAQEQAILASPPEKQIWDGKKFMPLGQLTALHDDILKKQVSEQAKQAELDRLSSRFWALEAADIVNMLVASHSRKAKLQLQRLEKFSTQRNGKAAGASHEAGKATDPKPEEKPLPIVKKVNPPSSSSSTDTLNLDKAGKSNQQTQEEAVRLTWE